MEAQTLTQNSIEVDLETHRYRVKTASTSMEMLTALQLRHEVFHCEMLNKKKVLGIDFDRFDSDCDHLIVLDKRSGETVGTYRLRSSLFTDRFYSSGEFDLSSFLEKYPGNKLELGRACIHKNYRNGMIIHLLWRAIGSYIRQTQTRFTFGCASLSRPSVEAVRQIYWELKKKRALLEEEDSPIRPLESFDPRHFGYDFEAPGEGVESSPIPPLLGAYLRAGARLFPTPAYDPDFQTLDFMTVLDTTKLQASYARKYCEAEGSQEGVFAIAR